MPVDDNVSELAATGGDGGATMPGTGRRRVRRTTGASGQMSDRSAAQAHGDSIVQMMAPASGTGGSQVPHPAAAAAAAAGMHSPQMFGDTLDNLTEDITDVPVGSTLPPLRTPMKPMRAVAPLPMPAGAANAAAANEPPFFYIQKSRGFKKTKGWPAMFHPAGRRTGAVAAGGTELSKQQAEAEEQRQAENQLLEVGLMVQRVEQATGMFIAGFLAGLTSWYAIAAQLLFIYLIPRPADGSTDYLKSDSFATFALFFEQMSMPIGCIFYALLAFCLLTIVDRYDVSVVRRNELVAAIRLQNTALPLMLVYTAALIVTLVCAQHDAMIYNVDASKLHAALTTTTTTTSTTTTTISSLSSSSTTTRSPFVPAVVTAANISGVILFPPTTGRLPLLMLSPSEPSSPPVSGLFGVDDVDRAITMWLRLNFARAACCTLGYLILVITSDSDRLAAYLRSMMENPLRQKVNHNNNNNNAASSSQLPQPIVQPTPTPKPMEPVPKINISEVEQGGVMSPLAVAIS